MPSQHGRDVVGMQRAQHPVMIDGHVGLGHTPNAIGFGRPNKLVVRPFLDEIPEAADPQCHRQQLQSSMISFRRLSKIRHRARDLTVTIPRRIRSRAVAFVIKFLLETLLMVQRFIEQPVSNL
jgi:hypothetical protein